MALQANTINKTAGHEVFAVRFSIFSPVSQDATGFLKSFRLLLER